MKEHTSFKVGGPADLYVEPLHTEELVGLLREARRLGLPVFVLGGGANILVSDRGIRGLVVSLAAFRGFRPSGELLTAQAGLAVSDASELAANAGMGGLDFIYAMPGSVGGAVWMNARCYDSSISDVLEAVRFLDEDLEVREITRRDPSFFEEFAYKKSPFQGRNRIILEATFRLYPASRESLWTRMNEIRGDRTKKGHFLAPSAGSVFKNNREFGAPSGVIIDRLGLRGFALGGARVSPLHGNIIFNEKNASAEEIRRLIETIQERVERECGFVLEPEVLYVGDWGPSFRNGGTAKTAKT